MIELFEQIEECDPSAVNRVYTLLEEDNLGEKALFSDDRLVWTSHSESFFENYKEDCIKLEESGIVTIAGRKLFCDTLGQEKEIVVCGGGHVSMPVIQIGRMIGCQVTVIEDRPTFADNARRAGASKVLCEPFEQALEKIPGSPDTYFVIVTRGHRYDMDCLRSITAKEHAYIGMIGSRRRVAMVKKLLIEEGVNKEVLDTVYTPIGLDIGAESPAEIGVAIMAEIIEVKNKKKRTYGYSKEMIRAILDSEKYPGKKVLMTIITKKGSAPQGIGVKMLLLEDGRCIGTIGGGCMESEIVRKARIMLASPEIKAQICQADLMDEDAAEDGMVCGGMVDVLLEVLEPDSSQY